MPKHTIKSINGRLKNGHFPGLEWRESTYNWYKSDDRRQPVQTIEDKHRVTLLGCGCWRTLKKEISAAAGIKLGNAKKLFKIEYGGTHFRVCLEFSMFEPTPGFFWEASHFDGWRQYKTRATDRKKFSDITQEDAAKFLKSLLMPAGYWLRYQLQNEYTKDQVKKVRRIVNRAEQKPRTTNDFAVIKSAQRHRAKVARQMEKYYPDLSALYWSDEDPEQFIFSL